MNRTCLDRADIVKLLIENEPSSMNQIAQIDVDLYNTRVLPSIRGKTFEQFTRQLERNVKNFTAVDANGNTALHIAVQHGQMRRDNTRFFCLILQILSTV